MKPAIHPSKSRGFTLVEVMIVVAIVGILSAIAIPSYTKYVRRSNRAEAQSTLMQAQQFMQRYYSANNTYLNNGALPALPASLQRSPSAGTQLYSIALDPANTNAAQFQLIATPMGAMTADPCGALIISSTGRRAVGGSGANATVDKCFK